MVTLFPPCPIGRSSSIPGECPHLLQEEEPQLVPQVQAQEQEECQGFIGGGHDGLIENQQHFCISINNYLSI